MITIETPLGEFVPSYSLREIKINASQDVTAEIKIGGESMLMRKYFVSPSGDVTIPDVGELVTYFFKLHPGLIAANVNLIITSGPEEFDKEFNVIYCSHNLGVEDLKEYFETHFVSIAKSVRVKPDDTVCVASYSPSNTYPEFSVQINCTVDGVEQHTSTTRKDVFSTDDDYGIYYTGVDFKKIREFIVHDYDTEDVTLLSAVIKQGQRTMIVFFDMTYGNALGIRFLNCFNIEETIYVNAVTKETLSVEKSIAQLHQAVMEYDVRNTSEFETQTAALSHEDMKAMRQIFTSNNVAIRPKDYNTFLPILLLSSKCESSDSDSEQNKVKFTWRFHSDEVRSILATTTRLFSQQFNYTYK